MKTLDQWLEDSDDDDDEENEAQRGSSDSDGHNASEDRRSSSSRVTTATRASGAPSFAGSQVSAHTPTTLRPTEHPPGGLIARQDETREKMRRLLGADVVLKATTPTSSTAGSAGSPTWPISAAPDRTHFPFGATPTATQPALARLWAPATLGETISVGSASGGAAQAPARTDTATDSSQLPEVEQTMKGFTDGVGGSGGGPLYAAVEVMVVDRGTQTVTSEGTQTDPTPIAIGPFYTGPFLPTSHGGDAGMRGAFGHSMMAPPMYGYGVDGRPYRQYLYDYEQREAEEATKLRAELGMIQNSIDMLIARYNLPPPPM